MTNGDGSASPDPVDSKTPGVGAESPGSLSRYSSCGGESEFERYCSANSVMGTPSFGSSFGVPVINNDFIETEFGSLKSLENFTLGGRLYFDGNLERSKLSDRLNFQKGVGKDGNDELGLGESEGNFGESSQLNNELHTRQGESVEEGETELGLEFDGCSSRYEHSDDESMYGSGSDEENRKNLYAQRKLKNVKEDKVGNENENPLLINSSIAFGSDDWDDFELQTGTLGSLTKDEFLVQKKPGSENESHLFESNLMAPVVSNSSMEPDDIKQVEGGELVENSESYVPASSQTSELKQAEEVRDIPVDICLIQGTRGFVNDGRNIPTSSSHLSSFSRLEQEDVRDISVTCSTVQGANSTRFCASDCDLFGMELDPLTEKDCLCVNSKEITPVEDSKIFENQETGNLKVDLPQSTDQTCLPQTDYSETKSAEFTQDFKVSSAQLLQSNRSENAYASIHRHRAPIKAEKPEVNELYDEIVNEMEEILLDSSESPGARFPQGNYMSQTQLSLPLRDGGSTASTSGTDNALSVISRPLRIDGVEVVGAKQKKGDVSLGERLVGVKEYTVYRIRVWSGKDQWEVERRYRDFCTLYRRLKSLFIDQGWTIPLPWFSVEKESRKIFGNASPDVISERSVLIQECLRSVIHSGYFSSPPSALVWFLSPQDAIPSSPASQKPAGQSVFSGREPESASISTLGKTISLIVEIRPHKSIKQLLEAQHYTCAGCHKHFDDGRTLVQDFVQVLGWKRFRLCEYTGQLFCPSCHTNESAVLPSRVLHYWDFTLYPVSQLAKSYLDSIHEQPMLCVSAVNPSLFSKVPALRHIMNIRKKIGAMLPYIRCPFRRTITKGLGSRRYLLESNDFFALKDLIDLSKGAFAALPVMVETVAQKILEHIADQCLICCDVGVPCCARQACDDPSSLIFPFQEGEIERCKSCGSVFHRACFRKLTVCSCGKVTGEGRHNANNMLVKRSNSAVSMGMISGLFSRGKPEKRKDHKDTDTDTDTETVILMGSLPSTNL